MLLLNYTSSRPNAHTYLVASQYQFHLLYYTDTSRHLPISSFFTDLIDLIKHINNKVLRVEVLYLVISSSYAQSVKIVDINNSGLKHFNY